MDSYQAHLNMDQESKYIFQKSGIKELLAYIQCNIRRGSGNKKLARLGGDLATKALLVCKQI